MSLKLFILFLKVAVGASLLSVEVSFRSLTILNMAFRVCNVKSMRKRLKPAFLSNGQKRETPLVAKRSQIKCKHMRK